MGKTLQYPFKYENKELKIKAKKMAIDLNVTINEMLNQALIKFIKEGENEEL